LHWSPKSRSIGSVSRILLLLTYTNLGTCLYRAIVLACLCSQMTCTQRDFR